MSDFGHVEKVRADVGGRFYTFRSKLEYRWAVWCQFRKEQDIIEDWWYEDTPIMLETRIYKNKKVYVPDFTVSYRCKNCEGTGQIGKEEFYYGRSVGWKACLECEGEGIIYEFEETKGYFPPKDYTKIRLAAQQYNNPITLIFAALSPTAKKTRTQYDRAKRLEPYLKRVIYNANKEIFAPLRYLFDKL